MRRQTRKDYIIQEVFDFLTDIGIPLPTRVSLAKDFRYQLMKLLSSEEYTILLIGETLQQYKEKRWW
jgi:hypothetical protein